MIIAKAMGHYVTVISSSDKKEALKHLGADAFLVSSNAAEMEGAANSLDYILDTVPAHHPFGPYLSLLKPNGKLVIVGAVSQPLQFDATHLILGSSPSLVINLALNVCNVGVFHFQFGLCVFRMKMRVFCGAAMQGRRQ